MKRSKEIDYLFEDPAIPNQKFALVSIVGPHMPQKCNVWGMKVRGIAESISRAREMSQKLMKIDNNYDIYTVEVGKFFPLAVDPMALNDIEYQNTQLNALMKSYLENREAANDQWHQRKNEMVQQAIKEGREQEDFANKPEHPISVLQRLKLYESRIKELEEHLESAKEMLTSTEDKWNAYTEEERTGATEELAKAIKTLNESGKSDVQVEDLEDSQEAKVDNIIDKIKKYENEMDNVSSQLSSLNKDDTPNIYSQLEDSKANLEEKLIDLKKQLNDTKLVNEYINSNYDNSEYDQLLNAAPGPSSSST